MTLSSILILSIAALTGGLILGFVARKRRESELRELVRSKIRTADLLQLREELKKLQNQTTRATAEYKTERDAYEKKYHSSSSSSGNDNGSGTN